MMFGSAPQRFTEKSLSNADDEEAVAASRLLNITAIIRLRSGERV
jgi:hypothetical protein